MRSGPYPRSILGSLATNPLVASLWTQVPELLQQELWPDCQYWQTKAEGLDGWPRDLRFSPDQHIGQRRKRKLAREKTDSTRPTLRRYETAICEAGEIPTREADLHDYFNALIWLRFPSAKYALHRSAWQSYQTPERQQEGNRRSFLADALTCFDEGGMVYFAAHDDDTVAIREIFQKFDDTSKLNFCVEYARRFAVFGHGLLEAWCRGGRGFTASLLIVEACDGEGVMGDDQACANRLSRIVNPRDQFGTMPFDAWLTFFLPS